MKTSYPHHQYSTAFQGAYNWILLAEGGYSDDPDDRGGETFCGLSRRAYPDLDLKTISMDEVQAIYHRDYWLKCRCDELTPMLAIALFDGAVNHGPGAAIQMLQRAAKATPDGVIGPKTLALIGQHKTGLPIIGDLLALYQARRCQKYARIVVNDTSQEKFLLGWMNRITKLQKHIYLVASRYGWLV